MKIQPRPILMYLVLILLLNTALILSFSFTAFQLLLVDLIVSIIYILGQR